MAQLFNNSNIKFWIVKFSTVFVYMNRKKLTVRSKIRKAKVNQLGVAIPGVCEKILLGFPIQLVHVSMMKTRGEWTPNLNYNELQREVLIALATKSRSLTGSDIKFIRKYFKITLQAFGNTFGVSHVAVIEWEKTGHASAKISPATEKCIRMFIIDSLEVSDQEFRQTHHHLKINELAEQQRASKDSGVWEPSLILDCQEAHFGLRQKAAS